MVQVIPFHIPSRPVVVKSTAEDSNNNLNDILIPVVNQPNANDHNMLQIFSIFNLIFAPEGIPHHFKILSLAILYLLPDTTS